MSGPLEDIELAASEKEYSNGFASVVAFIGKGADNISTIYRRFNPLAARNLLYLQSRLQKLEAVQDENDDKCLGTNDEGSKRAATSWEDFESLAQAGGSEKERMEVAGGIERALKTYHEALMLHSHVQGLKPPAENTLGAFQQWFEPEHRRTKLRRHSSHMLDDQGDVVALRVPADRDRLTRVVQVYFSWLFITETPDGPIAYISEHKIARVIAVVSILLAAVLLVGAIVALNYMHSQDWRMALVGIFTAMFGGSVGLLTSARRAEVLAATAAYTAVLVVSVSGNPPNGS